MTVQPLPAPDPAWALFLDFDGTLTEIAPTPESVTIADDLPALLDTLRRRLGGALAIVSGRPIAQIDHHLTPLRTAAAGLHGLELRPDGAAAVERSDASQHDLERARRSLRRLCDEHPALRLEDKGLALALHYRAAPALGAPCAEAAQALAQAAGGRLTLLHGKMVLELKPAGVDKGTVIETLLRRPPFRGRTPVFAGDDVTDEDGFRVVNALGGVSIRVGEPPDGRDSAARHQLADVAALRRWLGDVAGRLS